MANKLYPTQPEGVTYSHHDVLIATLAWKLMVMHSAAQQLSTSEIRNGHHLLLLAMTLQTTLQTPPPHIPLAILTHGLQFWWER